MNSFYTNHELDQFGFKNLGSHVMISRKASIYGAEFMSIGSNVRIDDFCILSGNISIGNQVHIAAYVALYGSKEGIEIHDFAGVSARTVVYAASDDYTGEGMTNPTVPDKYRKVNHGKVIICKHAIIGAGSIVLPGVKLGEGSSFGALSLINKNADEWSINVGIPSKKVSNRKKDILLLEQQYIEDLRTGGCVNEN